MINKFSKNPEFLALLFTASFCTSLFAQESEKNSDTRKLESKGVAQIDAGNWDDAKITYKELVGLDPNNDEFNFYLGLSYLQSGVESDKAADYLSKVNAAEIPERNYFYGQALHINGEYDKARKLYEEMIPMTLDNKKGRRLRNQLNLFAKQCDDANKAQQLYQNALASGAKVGDMDIARLKIENLGDQINTEKREYAPVVYQDLGFIAFAAFSQNDSIEGKKKKKGNEDIYFSQYNMMEDKWDARSLPDGKSLNASVNSSENESPLMFSSDMSKFIFYRNGDIWISEGLKDAKKLNIETEYIGGQDIFVITMSHDSNFRFLVTDVFPGKGGRDIYISEKTGESWSKWTNLEGINTSFDEDSPYLSEDGSLYFSSQGHNSIGGHDIFKATKLDTYWGSPVNLGMPINSPANDIHFFPVGTDNKTAYFASDRVGGFGSFDIYRVWTCDDIEETTIKGRVLADGKPVKTDLYVKDPSGTTIQKVASDELSGAFSYNVKPNKAYKVELSSPNYMNQTFDFAVPEQCSEYSLYQEFNIEARIDENGALAAQVSSMANAFYDIDRYRKDKSESDFIAQLPDKHRLKPEIIRTKIDIEKPILLAAAQFKDVRFAFASDKVSGTAEGILDNVVDYLKKFENVTLVLSGHTDTKGPEAYNKVLSKKRAMSVQRILVAKGINKNRIDVKFFGEEQPLFPDYDENGNYLEEPAEKNRRVEIEVKLPK